MKEAEEIKEMMLQIKEQGEGRSGIISVTLEERLRALAWVLDYPEMPTLILSDGDIELMQCF